MKTQLCYLKQIILLGFVLLSLATSAQEIGGTFDARLEERLGRTHLQNGEWLITRSKDWVPLRADYSGAYRGPTANFLAEENFTRVAFYFTAETKGNAMEVRMLVDGVIIDPGAISFSSGFVAESRSFIFTGIFDKGIHTVQLEWRGLQDNKTTFIRDVSLLIRKDDNKNVGQMAMRSIMANTTVVSNNWVDIPNSTLLIASKAGDALIASAALEVVVAPGESLYLRAMVNGVPLLPTDVLFARGNRFQAKTMTFGLSGLSAGRNSVKFQWKVSGTGSAGVQGRSFVASAMPKDATDCEPHMKFKAAPSGPTISTNSPIMKPIPDMGMDVSIPENGEMVIIFSAESFSSPEAQNLVTLEIDQQFYSANMVTLAQGTEYLGVHSFVFVVKHLNAKSNASLKHIQLHWSSGGNGTAYMGDRSMAVLVEKGGVPDLAEPPAIGSVGNPIKGQPGGIEPMTGNVPLLAIMIDPERSGHPAPEIDSLDKRLFGHFSTQDYYNKISGGRFTLSKVDILSFKADLTDEYWTHHSCDSTIDPVCDTADCIQVGYTGGHARRWAEALDKADAAGFNFAQYDKNKDGILDPRELAILIITPQSKESGSNRAFNPYCPSFINPDGRYVVDGVRIPAIAEWYTRASQVRNMVTPTHELGHLLLNLGDLYNLDKDIATEAGFYDLMGEITDNEHGTRVPHLQGRTKLALGWARPRFVRTSGTVSIEDVRTSEDVFILPRTRKVDGKEFFLLENRGTMVNNPGYDANIRGSGIAVWHIVESPALFNLTPKAVTCVGNWADVDGGVARRTARLIRPTVNLTDEENSLWNSATGYDLFSFGFSCGNSMRNALIWADDAASGYSIRNWPAYSSVMDVDITVPRSSSRACPDDSDPLGVGTIGGGRREGLESSQITSICEVYPNPFRESTHFSFSMKQDAQVKLEIFNLRGQRVAVPFEGRVIAGEKLEAHWRPGEGLTTGLYLYRLTTDRGDILQGKINWIR